LPDACGWKRYLERKSCGLKNIRICVDRASDNFINRDSCLLSHCYDMHILNGVAPFDVMQNVPRPWDRIEAILAQAVCSSNGKCKHQEYLMRCLGYLPEYTPLKMWHRFQAYWLEKTESTKNAVSAKLKFTTGRSRNNTFLRVIFLLQEHFCVYEKTWKGRE